MKHELSETYTTEDLREIAYRGSYNDMERAMARQLLAVHEQEPSATLFKSGDSAKVIMIGSDLPDGYTDVFAHPAPSGTNQVDELVMLVKRLAHSLKKANPDSKLHLEAMDYLKRNALIGITDLLRVSHPAPSIQAAVPEGISQWIDDVVEYLKGGLEADGELEAEGSIEAKQLLSRHAAMLQSEPQNAQQNIPEIIPTLRDALSTIRNLGPIDAEKIQAERDALNTLDLPDGWVMVPIELLSELRDFAHPEIEKYCEMWAGRRDSEFPAMRKIIADADAFLAAAPKGV